MSEELTSRQRKVHEFLATYLERHGLPPTTTEIQQHFGFASDKAARDHLAALARKGWVELIPGKARGIRVLRDGDGAGMVHGGAQARGAAARAEAPMLPLVGRIAAGAPLLSAECIEDHLQVDPALFSPRAHFLRRIEGRSMERAGILPGDLVGIHAATEAWNRQIIAARITDRATGEPTLTLKRYRREGDVVLLLSENDDQEGYPPIRIDLAVDEFAVEGHFVGLIRTAVGAARP